MGGKVRVEDCGNKEDHQSQYQCKTHTTVLVSLLLSLLPLTDNKHYHHQTTPVAVQAINLVSNIRQLESSMSFSQFIFSIKPSH